MGITLQLQQQVIHVSIRGDNRRPSRRLTLLQLSLLLMWKVTGLEPSQVSHKILQATATDC